MKGLISRGRTSNIAFVFLPDTTSTTGAGKTGLTNASAGLLIAIRRTLSATMTAYSGANIGTIATLGTWVNPGAGKCNFKEVDSTNAPGVYELHFTDDVFGTSDTSRVLLGMVQATGVAPTPFEIELIATNLQDAVAFGLSTLDAAISSRLAGVSYTAPDNSSITAIKAKTDNLPAAPAAVGDIPTAAAIRTEMDSNSTKLANLDAAVSSRNAVTPPTVAAIRQEIDDNSTKLDVAVSTRLAAADYTVPPTAGTVAGAVWDEAVLDHQDVGSTGAALGSVGASNPWDALQAGPFASDSMGEYFTETVLPKLNSIGTSSGRTVMSPMQGGQSFDFTITRGDAYKVGGPSGREQIEWRNESGAWLDYVGKEASLTIESLLSKEVTFEVVSGDVVRAYMELDSADTSDIPDNAFSYNVRQIVRYFDVQVATDTDVNVTPISGRVTILKDVIPEA